MTTKQWVSVTVNNINEIVVEIDGTGTFAMEEGAARQFAGLLEVARKIQALNVDLVSANRDAGFARLKTGEH